MSQVVCERMTLNNCRYSRVRSSILRMRVPIFRNNRKTKIIQNICSKHGCKKHEQKDNLSFRCKPQGQNDSYLCMLTVAEPRRRATSHFGAQHKPLALGRGTVPARRLAVWAVGSVDMRPSIYRRVKRYRRLELKRN